MAPDLAPAYGDRVRLLEVFDNLVENAVKHAGADAAKIEISSRRQGDEVLTCIADNGIGIDPAHQGKIFELFTKLDPAAEGSGIGLAIVKRIVEVHGGRIWVESPGTGGGTTFCFSLPTPPPDQGSIGSKLALASSTMEPGSRPSSTVISAHSPMVAARSRDGIGAGVSSSLSRRYICTTMPM
jgi:hypothetical protein